MDDLYLKKESFDNSFYSVDMIRLKTYLTYSEFTEIEFRFMTCWESFVKNKYMGKRITDFKYNYNLEFDDGSSFWFGFFHNSEKASVSGEAKYNFTIEFNPNKIRDNKVLMYLLSCSGDWVIKQLDLAIDFQVNIMDIIYDKGRKRNIQVYINSGDNRTIYLGKGAGRIKIYNKKAESNLKILGDLTRVEKTLSFDDFSIRDIVNFKLSDDIFPILYLNKYLYSFKDYEDKTLLAILYAVQSGFEVNNLSRVYKQKVKKLFEGGYKVRFSSLAATKIVKQIIYYYFMNNKKVRFK